jgi:hypothetical protein
MTPTSPRRIPRPSKMQNESRAWELVTNRALLMCVCCVPNATCGIHLNYESPFYRASGRVGDGPARAHPSLCGDFDGDARGALLSRS